MGHDGGHIRNLEDGHDRRKDGELVGPVGGGHPLGGDDQLMVDIPQPYGLGQHDHHKGDGSMDGQRGRKGLAELDRVARAELVAEETRRGPAHGAVQEAEYGHYPANDIVNTKV